MLGTLTLPSQPCLAFRPRPRHRRRGSSVVAEVAPHAAGVDNRCLYEVLRVERGASQVEIKAAYRTLAKVHHPDAKSRFIESSIATAADGRDFIEIRDAYATLSDPDARAVYDCNLNLNSKRRWNVAAGLSGFQSPGRGRSYPTRRWETDQCW
ncbi:hypothetical protein ABFS82_08G165900 [Erythranthe guttata]|uniref:chaperone protein dnaJ 11, chloroplastic-like n=1 Tax=Erythranthe guttata TaxID=4155 RepID=UPI00064D8BDC|nr:PREDICTED: chaperone protein dnaJ 11, chloroplastic-like [Erythranthe guttata]|eukprot:XP_012841596.1 PREDICTED: chaperone protein dnaJ 11, chloroplastic-like [Erythranthe guttata]